MVNWYRKYPYGCLAGMGLFLVAILAYIGVAHGATTQVCTVRPGEVPPAGAALWADPAVPSSGTPVTMSPTPRSGMVTRLGPVIVSASAATRVDVNVGTLTVACVFAAGGTCILPPGLCGLGPLIASQTGSATVGVYTYAWEDVQ